VITEMGEVETSQAGKEELCRSILVTCETQPTPDGRDPKTEGFEITQFIITTLTHVFCMVSLPT
jgi:hypothetical protein